MSNAKIRPNIKEVKERLEKANQKLQEKLTTLEKIKKEIENKVKQNKGIKK